MSNPLKFALTALVALAGCAPMKPMPPMDVAPITTQSGEPMTSRFNAPETGRDWNCKGCFK